MSNRYFRRAAIIAIVSFFGAALFTAEPTFANSNYSSRTEWGARDVVDYTGKDKLGYSRSISGASWYYYEITKTGYSEDDRIYVPVANNYSPKVAIPAKTCQSYGGFWVLLRNEYNKETGELTGRPAAAIKLSDIRSTDLPASVSVSNPTNIITFKGNRVGTPEDSQDGVTPIAYGDMNDVLNILTNYVGTTAVPLDVADNIGELSYFCANKSGARPPAQPVALSSFSTVTVGGGATSAPVLNQTSYLGGNNETAAIAIPVGSALPEITFDSYLARVFSDYDLKGDSSEISYTIETNGVSDSGKISISSLNNRENRWNFGGINYLYSDKVTKTVKDLGTMGNSRRTICQKITTTSDNVYSSDTLTINGSETVTSEACIIFVPVASLNGSVVNSCEQGGNGRYMYRNSYMGNTVATIGVSKNNGQLLTTTAAATVEPSVVTTYAKPGDVIRFSYSICFGANDVNYDGEMVTGGNHSGNQIDSWFRVYVGTKNDDQPSVYSLLFGNQDELLGGTVYVDKIALRGGELKYNYDGSDNSRDEAAGGTTTGSSEEYKITNSGYWNSNKRQLAFSSPDAHQDVSVRIGGGPSGSSSEDEGDELIEGYGCTYYSGLSSDNATGYVIPGFEGNLNDIDCDSAVSSMYSNGTPITSAVGATLSHSLEYAYIAAWPVRTNSRQTVASLEDIINSYNQAYDEIKAGSGLQNSSGRAVSSGNADAQTVTKTASVVIPYNFDTNISGKITNNNSQITYPGDTIKYSATVDVLPRANPVTSDIVDDKPVSYATTMPEATKVELVEFLVKDSADASVAEKIKQDYLSEEDKNLPASKRAYSTGTICEYYTNILGDNLADCEANTVRGLMADEVIGNGSGNPEGEKNYYNAETDLVVPDVKAGYKYCVAVAISYGDSHGFPGGELSDDPNQSNFGANATSANRMFSTSMNYRWRTANASCRTVAKKPSFQAWNSGVYSGDNITSSVMEKSVNARLFNLPPGSSKPKDDDTREIAKDPVYFGSWAEYYVVAKGEISGFASASALGYTTSFGSLSADGYGRPYNYCNLSRLTLANTNCKSGTAGKYDLIIPKSLDPEINNNASDPGTKNLRAEITQYYIPPAVTISNSGYQGTYAGSLSTVSDADYFPGGWNGAQLLIKNGDFIIDKPYSRTAGTLVIQVKGHLIIDSNICLGGGTCTEAGGNDYATPGAYAINTNNLSLNERNTDSFLSVKDIPQVIIMAESISIGSDVSQIDAWLITNSDKADYDGGYINTCGEFRSGQTGTSKCWKTLKINGPVVTTALLLNRTGGAWPGYSGDVGNQAYKTLSQDKLNWKSECIASGVTGRRKISNCVNQRMENYVNSLGLDEKTKKAMLAAYAAADRYGAQSDTYSANNAFTRDLSCDGSITPAEIFDLHPIVYYWAYGQSQKLAQAIVTYAQEFAPRY